MKKKIVSILLAGLAAITAFGAIGCGGGGDEVVTDVKTLNIKSIKAGYGVDHLYALKDRFEQTFAEEGYKVNILTPQRDIQDTVVLSDIMATKGVGVDIYFTDITNEREMVSGDYGQCAADITELVWNQKPIGFDKKEEDVTVASKLNFEEYYYSIMVDGKCYAIPWHKGTRGLAVNKKVLENYNLTVPRTTKELFHCYEVIMKDAYTTGVFPFTAMEGTNSYSNSFQECTIAQYDGLEAYNRFWSFDNADGTAVEKPYELFGSEGIKIMINNLYRLYDHNVLTYGSTTQDFMAAQGKFMNGSCAFMPNGVWLLNEVKQIYGNKLDDITFINVPVVSELGVKTFASYGFNEKDCDEVMSAIIAMVDENKEISEIKTTVDAKYSKDFKEADIKRIAEARGIYIADSVSSKIIISEKSQKKDIAALFLRMCASQDGAKLISDNINAGNPFDNRTESSSKYEFVRKSMMIPYNKYGKGITGFAAGTRKTVNEFKNLIPYAGQFLLTKVREEEISIYDDMTGEKIKDISVYMAAEELQRKAVEDEKKKWENRK